MSDLLPCPFCGGEASFEEVRHKDDRRVCHWSVGCSTEGCAGWQSYLMCDRKVEAAAAWNTRAAASAPVDIRAVWRTAITLAHNICVQESDRHRDNDEDGAGETYDCSVRIKGWLEPSDEQLREMIAECTGAALKASAPVCQYTKGCTNPAEVCLKHVQMCDHDTDEVPCDREACHFWCEEHNKASAPVKVERALDELLSIIERGDRCTTEDDTRAKELEQRLRAALRATPHEEHT